MLIVQIYRLETFGGDFESVSDRNDPAGRLRLLDTNVEVYRQILPQLIEVAAEVVILVLTDPPDPLADFVRTFGFKHVLSSGTFITIIEGNQASQFCIGMVSARLAEMVLCDERAVIPIGSYDVKYGVTLTTPSVLGRSGVAEILEPDMSEEERQALQRSAEALRNAVARIQDSHVHS
jgi:malate/lactate dehydrogenase